MWTILYMLILLWLILEGCLGLIAAIFCLSGILYNCIFRYGDVHWSDVRSFAFIGGTGVLCYFVVEYCSGALVSKWRAIPPFSWDVFATLCFEAISTVFIILFLLVLACFDNYLDEKSKSSNKPNTTNL